MIDPLPRHTCVAIFGLGASGLAAAHLLASFNKTIIASDTADESRRDELTAKLPKGTKLVLGHNEIGDATIIVTSPGLEPSSPIFKEAAERNIPVIAELELGFRATTKPIVAITGTDGKTTTTTLTSHILNTCGVRNKMGGNVGIPLCQVVMEQDEPDCYVVETSAFQLVFCPEFRPHILIATNIAEDHSEYFKGDWEAYVATKRRPLMVMGENDIAILNATDPEIRRWSGLTKAKADWYAEKSEDFPGSITDADAASIDEGAIQVMTRAGNGYRLNLADLKLKGAHNAMNVMGSILACLEMGCQFDAIVSAIDSYELPHHRIEHICTTNGVEFIDDSKATNPHAGMAALAAIDRPTVLIVGGVDKGLSLTAWIDAMQKNVRQIMLIGALTDRFLAEARWGDKPCPITLCKTLEEAVERGYDYACNHGCEVVMLSPGCSSYDMFKSYGQRGEAFAHAALGIKP